ncbi:MAG TPA: tRNA lysidine(34) synthetase TilS [Luteitalea sp.]|nr:tRNA lysidine(34) synthetase TilS [Luteitalea sp.]
MTRFPTRVWSTIQQHRLLVEGDRVLVAVSGGADSTALAHVLASLAPRARVRIVGLVHVHHGLRGAEADADAAACEALATTMGVSFDLIQVDVRAEAMRRRWSIERTGHALRHAAYRMAARRRLATRIALGHTLDDQAETVILRLLRGAGTRGLSGIWPMRGLVIRPLLETRRAAVEHYLAERGLRWREDASNRDESIPRNAVRHSVLPTLMRVAGASLPERLARQADAWRDDERWLAASVAVEVPSLLMPDADGGWLLDVRRLEAVPPMLRRRVRQAALEQMLPRGQVTLAIATALARLERLPEGRAARLRGLQVTRSGSLLRFASVGADTGSSREPRAGLELTLTVPGRMHVADLGLELEASVLRRSDWRADAPPDETLVASVALDASAIGHRMVVRTRRPGDRMRPSGLQGSQKIQDLMVNRKVPRHERDRVAVITTETGQIAWVVGLAVGEEFAVQPHTTRVLLLSVTRPGGKA